MSEGRTYFKIFHVAESDLWGAKQIRAITKWWLDLMRNLVVVAALLYLSKKADNWPLTIVAYISYGALVAYCLTYTAWWFFYPLHRYEGRTWLVRTLWYQIANVVSLVTFWFVWIGLTGAVDAISKAQAP